MNIVETRFYEGPNVFLLEPAIKIEVQAAATDQSIAEALDRLAEIKSSVLEVHHRLGLVSPQCSIEELETRGHIAFVFSWSRRKFADALAMAIAKAVDSNQRFEASTDQLRQLLSIPESPEDRPFMILDSERSPTTIAVTGTNGKTTTTRLISHIFQLAGRKVGWSCSSGVYIDGDEVLTGDYSGPRGALRVLEDSNVEIAVVETARGGILLRGIATESVDVSVFTNISGDHLDLQGIRTVDGLARVKAVVSRITRADGVAVLNADDPLVMSSTRGTVATQFLVSRDPANTVVTSHIESGGMAMVSFGDEIVLHQARTQIPVASLDDVPMTYRGTAGFMVENALFGSAAAYAAKATLEEVQAGLRSFSNTSERNPGRLNVYDLNGIRVILDFAHNEAGLEALLDFAHAAAAAEGRVCAVIGTAGDRNDLSLRELGRIAATRSDYVIAKGTKKYLRGRDPEALMTLYAEGARLAGSASYSEADTELAAVKQALTMSAPGDAIAIMAQEEFSAIRDYLAAVGATPA